MKNKRKQRGQGLAETALVIPVLFIMLAGLFEVGRAFLILISVENATAEGALYGAINPECLVHNLNVPATEGGDLPYTVNCVETIDARIEAEGHPFVDLTGDTADIVYKITDAANVDATIDDVADYTFNDITAGKTLWVTVKARFTPLTFVGQWIWGDEGQVEAHAEQIIFSPPPPGTCYNNDGTDCTPIVGS
jgi:hypothetical protein